MTFATNNFKAQILKEATENKQRKIISRFYKFHEALENAGFGLIPFSFQKDLLIYDRSFNLDGTQNNKSAYSVFVWVKKNGILIKYKNPDFSESAMNLKINEIVKLAREPNFSLENNIDKIIADIKTNSSKKPEYIYFLALHDHLRYVDNFDFVKNYVDDGLSDWKTMILHKKSENIDFDLGTTCHNHFVYEQIYKIKELEEKIGITKGASLELTMPFSKHSTNGPHHLLWFANFEVAREYQERFLSKRIYKYPAYAADTSPKKLKKENQKLRKENLLAVGIAHPASGLKFPILGVPPVGIIDVVGEGTYSLDYIYDYVKEYIDSIGCFNCLANKEIRTFANPSEGRRITELIEKWNTGEKAYANVVNMAFAKEMNQIYNIANHSDNDTHRFHLPAFRYIIHGYGKAWTVFDAKKAEIAYSEKPTIEDIIYALREKRDSIFAFIPYCPKEADLVKQRRNEILLQKAEDLIEQISFHIKNTIPTIFEDVKKRLMGLFN
jgi:hypothetical protein